jgi:hypothetical protein
MIGLGGLGLLTKGDYGKLKTLWLFINVGKRQFLCFSACKVEVVGGKVERT